jgi:hypothetical protein
MIISQIVVISNILYYNTTANTKSLCAGVTNVRSLANSLFNYRRRRLSLRSAASSLRNSVYC